MQTIVTGAGDETLRFWNAFPSPKSQVSFNILTRWLFESKRLEFKFKITWIDCMRNHPCKHITSTTIYNDKIGNWIYECRTMRVQLEHHLLEEHIYVKLILVFDVLWKRS